MTVANQTKICASCGRRFTRRKRWRTNWNDVRYCSDGCRRHTVSHIDRALESGILELLDRRDRQASICPSEVARSVAPDAWRELMEPTRRAARRLAADRVVEITQRGKVVDPTTFRGPIRIRKVARP